MLEKTPPDALGEDEGERPDRDDEQGGEADESVDRDGQEDRGGSRETVENEHSVDAASDDVSTERSSKDADKASSSEWIRPAEGSFEWPEEEIGRGRPMSRSEFVSDVADQPVLVIGIFGKSELSFGMRGRETSKDGIFDHVMQRDVFWIRASDELVTDRKTFVQGFHDRESGRIYLNLKHIFDTNSLLNECSNADRRLKEDGFQAFMSDPASDSAKLILFMLHVCHLVVLYHPNHNLDVSYVHLFKTLDAVRSKLQPVLSETLRGVPNVDLGKDWIIQGRQCPPRILFYFASAPLALRGSKGTSDLVKRDGKVSKHPPIRKLEFSLEDQIYQIFRKARVVTSSPNCLFNIPSRDGFVYVENGTDTFFGDAGIATMGNFYHMLENPCDPVAWTGPFLPYFHSQNAADSRSQRCFSRFLQTHLATIQTKGTDAEGRIGLELPTALTWYKVSEAILPIFEQLSGPSFGTSSSNFPKSESSRRAASILSAHTEIDMRFSEARCSKALPQAILAYKEGLQPHYVEEYHNAKLLQAMSVFYLSARGPACASYAEKLAEECASYWRSGRQMCEEISLTGSHCTNRKHVVHGQPEREAEEQKHGQAKREQSKERRILPVMSHNSGVTFLSACNCGRRQSNREDPFTIMDANYKFYAEVEEECCHDLEHLTFPVYQQAKSAFRPTPVLSSSSLKGVTLEGEDDVTKALEGLDLMEEATEEDNKETLQSLADLANSKSINRQTSSIEPIAHMLTKETPLGKLPIFSSWSLVQLGSSYLYSHSSGISQPGFLSGSKFLLPWDISLSKVTWETVREKWPNLAESAMKRPNFNPNLNKGEPLGLSVKVFLGFEYECPRGHRFLAASAEKAVRASTAAGVRDAAGRLVANDMPLYMACPCRTQRPLLAQLMRIHIVTPKAPIHVTLLPLVQPNPFGPIFHTGWAEPTKLPHNSCWVLRLPYIYSGESGAHMPPKIVSECVGRFLKGSIAISEDFEDKTLIM